MTAKKPPKKQKMDATDLTVLTFLCDALVRTPAKHGEIIPLALLEASPTLREVVTELQMRFLLEKDLNDASVSRIARDLSSSEKGQTAGRTLQWSLDRRLSMDKPRDTVKHMIDSEDAVNMYKHVVEDVKKRLAPETQAAVNAYKNMIDSQLRFMRAEREANAFATQVSSEDMETYLELTEKMRQKLEKLE